jgi:hypothetical protein
MSDVRAEGVAGDVGGPFVFCGVAGADADVAGLKGLEVLLGAQFIGHVRGRSGKVWEGGGSGAVEIAGIVVVVRDDEGTLERCGSRKLG